MTSFKNTVVGKFLYGIVQEIKDLFDKVEPKIEEALEEAMRELKAQVGDDLEQLLAAGGAALEQAASEGKSPSQWLDPVYDAIEAKAKDLGKNLSSTLTNLLTTIVQGKAKSVAVSQGTTVQAILTAEAEQPAAPDAPAFA